MSAGLRRSGNRATQSGSAARFQVRALVALLARKMAGGTPAKEEGAELARPRFHRRQEVLFRAAARKIPCVKSRLAGRAWALTAMLGRRGYQ